jgi:hypothetical protein
MPENIGEPEIVAMGPEYFSAIIAASDNVIKPPPISILGLRGMVKRNRSLPLIKCQPSEA